MCVGMGVQFLRIKQGEIMIEYTVLKITRQMEAEGNIHSISTQWLSGKEVLQFRRHRFDQWVKNISWRRAWQPTPVFSPGESHGQRSLAGCRPWGHKESYITEATEHAPILQNVSVLDVK